MDMHTHHDTTMPVDERRKVSLVIPAYNEGRGLLRLRDALTPLLDNRMRALSDGREIAEYDYEVLLVNDGSRDDTLQVLRELRAADPRFCYVSLSRNFGKEAAMLAGLDYATGHCVVILDADLQHPVEAIPRMIAEWESGYDDVYGRRATRGRESWLRRRLSMAYYSMLQSASDIDVMPNVGDFRLLDRRCVDAVRSLRETQRYSKGLFAWIGYSKKDVEFVTADREEGASSFSYRRLFNLAVEGITSHSTAPLRIASVVGFVTAIAAFVYLIFTVVRTLLYGDPVAGYPTLICVLLLLGGLQLCAIGIVGEYIGRIFMESKRRPVYIADIYNDSKV